MHETVVQNRAMAGYNLIGTIFRGSEDWDFFGLGCVQEIGRGSCDPGHDRFVRCFRPGGPLVYRIHRLAAAILPTESDDQDHLVLKRSLASVSFVVHRWGDLGVRV
jgi:hypothetical protein